MKAKEHTEIRDTGERILPAEEGEVSVVFARHQFIYRHVAGLVADQDVLDVGCGTGYGCKILAEKAKHVYGIDHDAEAIRYCRQHFDAPNVTYAQMDAAALTLDRRFDAAVTFQVIEHVKDANAFLQQLRRAVKPEGTIFITTPNVRKPQPAKHQNPFHFNEMNYEQFHSLLSNHFDAFELQGVAYAASNRLRDLLGKTPLYRWGKILKRKSTVKKLANRVMDLTNFKIIEDQVANDAEDLFAICRNPKPKRRPN